VLLIGVVIAKVLFEGLVLPFGLAVRLGVKRCAKPTFHTRYVVEVGLELASKNRASV